MMSIFTKRTFPTFAVWLMLAAGGLLLAGCSGEAQETAKETRIPVLTARVQRHDLSRSRTYAGSVEGIRQATVYARISETVAQVHVTEGKRVTAGTPLVTFDESGPSTQLRQAQAVAEDARRNAEKFQRLFEQGAVSEQERDARQTAYDVAHADYLAAKERANVTSPLTGIVTEVYTRVGRQVMMGQPLALVASIDTIRVLVDISVYETEDLHEGLPVIIRSELDTSMVAKGWVDLISSSADANTRTISVEILAQNTNRRFKPGMFVRAEIELETHAQAINVVRDALVYRESGMGAYVIQDSTAHFVSVTTGIESGNRVEVLNGLGVGDEVVILGHNNIQEGSMVDPTEENSPSAASTTP